MAAFRRIRCEEDLKAYTNSLKQENDAIFEKYSKLKRFVKSQKKRTKSNSHKHEWVQRKSKLQQQSDEAENDLLASFRRMTDEDPELSEVFETILQSYEKQEDEMRTLSHGMNSCIIAFLSSKNYLLSVKMPKQDKSKASPIQQFSKDICTVVSNIQNEIDSLTASESKLSEEVRQHMMIESGCNNGQNPHVEEADSILNQMLSRYIRAEAEVKDSVRSEFTKLKSSFEYRWNALHAKNLPTSTTFPLIHSSRRSSTSFISARNEALKSVGTKGRRALLKELSGMLPHMDYSSLERQNDAYISQQHMKTKKQDLVDTFKREIKQVAQKAEVKLKQSSKSMIENASAAAAQLQWEVHTDNLKRNLKFRRAKKEINDEIQSFIKSEDEKKILMDKQNKLVQEQREQKHRKELVAKYHKRCEEEQRQEREQAQLRRLQEEEERAITYVENEKRTRYRQVLLKMREEDRITRQMEEEEQLRQKEARILQIAASVAPEVYADEERLKGHTIASIAHLKGEGHAEDAGFKPIHGYFDERLFQDQRFKIGHALFAAGLHVTDYGRQILHEVKSNSYRPEMKASHER